MPWAWCAKAHVLCSAFLAATLIRPDQIKSMTDGSHAFASVEMCKAQLESLSVVFWTRIHHSIHIKVNVEILGLRHVEERKITNYFKWFGFIGNKVALYINWGKEDTKGRGTALPFEHVPI
eukprot:38544-Pelagomonas_calceolata.AAC.1